MIAPPMSSTVRSVPTPAAARTADDSFSDFFRREYPNLVAVASALAYEGGEAEDLVQDTMVKAFVRWKRVRRLDKPGAWCHRVLLNGVRSWWRRRHTASRFVASQRPSAHAQAGPSVDALAFWEAVRELPTRPRMVVALYFAGELTTAEIATVLDAPEGTIRSDLTRARPFVMQRLRGDA